MVHLAAVKKDDEVVDHLARQVESIGGPPDENDYYTNVYGSHFAADHMPQHEMPEREMPRQVAARLIKDELSLDGNPKLNLASFVTTYMEEEIEQIMTDSFSKNFIDYEEYPPLRRDPEPLREHDRPPLQLPHRSQRGKCHGYFHHWFLGGHHAWYLGHEEALAKQAAVQVCWEKAARYFDIEERYVYCTDSRYVIDPKQAVDLIDENTIGICAIIGTTYTGEYEDVKGINDLLVERNIDCPIHVDAASGGFVAPFTVPDLEWDFRLEKVVSINVSGHKYGLVYPGVGWVIWRSPEYLPQELVFNINYLGADQASFTLNFSKGAAHVIGQYYQLIRLGKHGYRSIMVNLTRIADYLTQELEKLGMIIMSQSKGKGLPLVAFRLPPNNNRVFDEFAVAHQLRERGWVVPAYTMAPHSEKLQLMRIVIREDFSMNRCDSLLTDIKLALQTLESMDEGMIAKYKAHIQSHRAHPRNKRTHHAYHGEKHSLQGKTGKTHGVC
ncbi:Glutamate decarboxylase 4 [Penicillium chermesinum]|uniref:Glutamate decarboxylase n=1 Tax=Penicillium chermesinum TaxID=63820 RepID=A0A9W9TGC8_9EURO|nr:Glutamate decarboxylase 4 [Penicillium chermesinum]KAJ5220475.1 Glutamate decarboxylase 4 [Penicillium chermesinum]